MKKQTLRRALQEAIIGIDNFDNLRDADIFGTDLSDKELTKLILNEIVSDELLSSINKKISLFPVTSLNISDDNILSTIADDEYGIPCHPVKLIPKLCDSPIVQIGEEYDISTVFGYYSHTKSLCSFITNKGKWIFAYAYSTIIQEEDSEHNSITITTYEQTSDTYYGLECISSLIPDDYEGLLFNYL